MNNLKVVGIIPARYASTRFPGKPLADLGGKTMIQRVTEAASQVLDHVVVATDDIRIESAVKSFGGAVMMTSEEHKSGTDRCVEALEKYELAQQTKFDVVVNIQGDEPFIRKEHIENLVNCFATPETDIATLIKIIESNEVIFDPNRPKVVVDGQDMAIYFSRSPIPYLRDVDREKWHKAHTYFQHIGMYAYRSQVLRKITKLGQGVLEKAESLEQLRWLENGYRIKTAVTGHESYGIDTPADLERAKKLGLFD